uniref:Zinc transporter 6 n=1 Tax=Poecilia formosa TaxID=48698 RepID=A0A096LX10_POEFO
SVERFVEQPEVQGRLLVGTFVALFFNLLTLLSVRNKPFSYVSDDIKMPDEVREWRKCIKTGLVHFIPSLSSLLSFLSSFILLHSCFLLTSFSSVLLLLSVFFAVLSSSCSSLPPLRFAPLPPSPKILHKDKLNLTLIYPHYISRLLKITGEVSTLDGVLEVRNEHFWTVGFGSLAGSAHVRIRRDANEQLVLAHVTNRLLPLVTTLTVQIFKDDWTRPLLSGVLSSPAATPPLPVAPEGYAASFPPVLYGSAGGQEFDPLTSTPSKSSSPPPEFSFNTPGRNVAPLVLPAPGQHTHRPYGGLGLSYGAPPYAGMPGFRLPSSHSYRTAFVGSTPPLRFGTGNPAAPQS